MADREANPYQAGQVREKRSRAAWMFGAAGFSVAFVGLLLAKGVYAVAPGLAGAMRVPLWRFYVRELSRRWDSSWVPTGPASNGPGLWPTLLEHLLFAAVGGAICAGVAFGLRHAFSRR